MTIETAPGQYDWTELDAIVATPTTCQDSDVMLSVQHAPDFLSQPDQRPLAV